VVTIEIVGRWPIIAATPYNITTPLQRICRLQIRVHYENIEIPDYCRCIFSSTQWKALSPSIERYICNLITQFHKNNISSSSGQKIVTAHLHNPSKQNASRECFFVCFQGCSKNYVPYWNYYSKNVLQLAPLTSIEWALKEREAWN
jgi:hypothetical protein